MPKPKLSIITITYNNSDIKRTLDSILSLNTNIVDIEHIIVDNLSTDNTPAIVALYIKSATYPVKYIREKDAGRYDAMNKGIKASSGKYVSFMNAGDHFYDQNAIQNIFDFQGDYDIVYGNLNIISKESSQIFSPPDQLDFKFFLNSALPHQASIIKRNLLEKFGLYDKNLTISADHNFFLQAIIKHKSTYLHIDRTIATYYLNGISSDPKSRKTITAEKDHFLNENFSTIKQTTIKSKEPSKFDTPILFIIFNRPDTTQQVFNQIKKIKPKYLYISADGPRDNKEGEAKKCAETRKIIDQIDWDCHHTTLFREVNFGCGNSVSKAITWFFENVSEGIILEDDCIPDLSFFNYCQTILKKYRHDKRIMHICGTTVITQKDSPYSYYFSKYYQVWGWATWKRAWDLYDFHMNTFPEFLENNRIADVNPNPAIQSFWMRDFHRVYKHEVDTWDYQWAYANFINNGLSIMPLTNLIQNIGFGEGATHTVDANDPSAQRTAGTLQKIVHPKIVLPNSRLDNLIYQVQQRLNLSPLPATIKIPSSFPKTNLKDFLFPPKSKVRKTLIYLKHLV